MLLSKRALPLCLIAVTKNNELTSLTFRFVFIPWLQSELDAYCDRVNITAKRLDRNKILPHGVPAQMFEHPEDYAALDFKVQFSYRYPPLSSRTFT